MKNTLKIIGSFALGIVLTAVGIIILLFFIKGGVWLSEKLLPFVSVAAGWTFYACLFVMVPLAVFHRTRGYAGVGLFIASYIFGVLLWMTGLMLTYSLWGLTATSIGLFMFGGGVVITAIVAALFNGVWPGLFLLAFLVFLTYGSRWMSFYVIEKHGQQVCRF